MTHEIDKAKLLPGSGMLGLGAGMVGPGVGLKLLKELFRAKEFNF
jgi:hypothetical protein